MSDVAVLERLLAEANRVIARQISTGEDLDSKASDLLGFNALVIGIVLSATALTYRAPVTTAGVPPWILIVAGAGLAAIGISTLLALLAYEVTRYGIGMRARSLRQVLDVDMEEREFLQRLVRTYADVLEGNREPLDRTADRLRGALWTLLGGLVLLGAAAGGFMYAAI